MSSRLLPTPLPLSRPLLRMVTRETRPAPLELWPDEGLSGEMRHVDLELITRHRRSECPLEPHCVWVAAAQHWRGLSCVGCVAYRAPEKAVLNIAPNMVVSARAGDLDGEVNRARNIEQLRSATYEPLTVRRRRRDYRLEVVGRSHFLASAQNLGLGQIAVVEVGIALCPVCGTWLRPIWKHKVLVHDGQCPTCLGHIIPTTTEAGVEVASSESSENSRSRELCPYCSSRPSVRRGGCERCRYLLTTLTDVPRYRKGPLLRAVHAGAGIEVLVSVHGVTWELARRLVELARTGIGGEQLKLALDGEAA